jgi:hypothetical protein
MVDRRPEPGELGDSRVACGLGTLCHGPFGVCPCSVCADESGSLGDGQRLDLGEVAARLLSARAPLGSMGLDRARRQLSGNAAAQGGALIGAA